MDAWVAMASRGAPPPVHSAHPNTHTPAQQAPRPQFPHLGREGPSDALSSEPSGARRLDAESPAPCPTGGLDCPLPAVTAGRQFPVPALCARGLLANLEWHGPTAGERVRAVGPVPSRPAGTAGSQNKGPSVGSELALGMAGAEATPSEPGGLRRRWVPDTWDLPARRPRGALRAFREMGAPGPVLWATQASPSTSPGLRPLLPSREPPPLGAHCQGFEQPPFLEPQARAQGLASGRGTWAPGPAPFLLWGVALLGFMELAPLRTPSHAHCPDNSLAPLLTLGTGATHL